MRIFAPLACGLLLTGTATAQDNPNTILVMDGSGSMWGQIDGTAKITIAQDVVAELIGTIPSDQGLGLTVYGHRARGDCTDIETVVAPAAGTGPAIVDAVRGIKPLGKTPMTDAIIAAAEALRYTEDSATVILVSDGVETCNPDPCAAARLLEEAGIDFTAHVVGFDVGSDPDALAQMQCIAAETGGDFLTAENALELGAALTAVVQEPEPIVTLLTMEARLGDENGPLIEDQILWSVDGAFESEPGNPYVTDLIGGKYQVSAYWVQRETEVVKMVDLVSDAQTTTVVFPAPVEKAQLTGPETAPLGSTIMVGWDGPDGEDDYIGIGKVGADGAAAWQNYAYTRDGNPVSLLMPAAAGDYQIAYFQGGTRNVLGIMPITLTPIEVTVTAPTEAIAGSDIPVGWVGPDYDDDYIGIGKVGADGASAWENYAYTRDGEPATLRVPPTPGDYEISYFINQDRTVVATTPITVTDVVASVSAPAEAIAGSDIQVKWTGPDYDDDYIGIGKVGATGASAWENYAYTRDGDPATVTIPSEPGDYVITYFVNQDRVPLVSTPITVTAAGASVAAPAEAIAGSTLSVSWSGPGYDDDYIGIGKVGATGASQWENYTYVRADSSGTLLAPAEPGDYVISYFLSQDRTILASTNITLTKIEADVTAPSDAPMGSTISVQWQGPDYEDDYIGIGKADATGAGQWENYAYTHDGNPAMLVVPAEAGDYVIRYFAQQDRTMLASTPITITDVKAQLIAEGTAAAASEIIVGWDGPDYSDDYIGIGKVDATGGGQWETYAYTNSGNPVAIATPDAPGDYLIKYFIGQDRKVIASIPLRIE